MNKTSTQYDQVIITCKDIFMKKMKDYGTAWRILRTSSITDQLFIKAQRIRNIEDKGNQKIEDDIRSEYIGIINYSVIGLIQLAMKTVVCLVFFVFVVCFLFVFFFVVFLVLLVFFFFFFLVQILQAIAKIILQEMNLLKVMMKMIELLETENS